MPSFMIAVPFLLAGAPRGRPLTPATNTSAPIRHRLPDFFQGLAGTRAVRSDSSRPSLDAFAALRAAFERAPAGIEQLGRNALCAVSGQWPSRHSLASTAYTNSSVH